MCMLGVDGRKSPGFPEEIACGAPLRCSDAGAEGNVKTRPGAGTDCESDRGLFALSRRAERSLWEVAVECS